MQLGVSYEEFWHLNPKIIDVYVKGYNERIKNELRQSNMLFHLQGHYMADALLATVGNMFSSKGKKFEYPKEPYPLNMELESDLDMGNEHDRKIAVGRVNFVNQLNNMFGDINRFLEG